MTQLLATSQSPLASLAQSMVARSVRSSISSHRGRRAQIRPRVARRRLFLDRRSGDPAFFPPSKCCSTMAGVPHPSFSESLTKADFAHGAPARGINASNKVVLARSSLTLSDVSRWTTVPRQFARLRAAGTREGNPSAPRRLTHTSFDHWIFLPETWAEMRARSPRTSARR